MGKTLTCCTHTWRLIFVVLNVIFTIIGLALIGVGIWLIVEGTDYSFITDSLASPAALLIVAGVVTVVISIVGIVGALGMWYCVLVVYICCLAVVIILQITAGILGAVFRDKLSDLVEDGVNRAIKDYSVNDTDTDVNNFIDYIQNEFKCCGFAGPYDWVNTTFFNVTGRTPDSCSCGEQNCDTCILFGVDCDQNITGGNITGGNLVWAKGCNTRVTDRIQDSLGVVIGVGVAFGLFEISGVAIALALCICACMKKSKEDDFAVDDYVY
jgi:hypothetical protein